MVQALTSVEEASTSLLDRTETLTAVCQLVAGLYRYVLDEDAVNRLSAVQMSGDDDFVLAQADCIGGLSLMQEYCKGSELSAKLLVASNDFHDLFVGPHKLLAAPWSSVYMDKGGMIFGPTALQVKALFSEQGYVIPEGKSEPSDHIAYEWQFIADLQKKIVQACAAADSSKTNQSIEVLNRFMTSYFNPWIKEFLNKVKDNAKTDFYRGLSTFSLGLWSLEQDLLKDLENLGFTSQEES